MPLYRKYRPQKFSDLVGQENIKTALGNAIKLGKISHAYLFCGPRGTGKTSTARIFAKSLNCVNGPTVDPCGECPSCIDIINTTPVDVIELDAASNRSVDDAQKILESVQYVPAYGKYKIYIIDEVHMLTPQAFNSLLKTLEEPPKNVIFILATTEAHKVLDTIISRCQRFDFRRITIEDIVKRLKYICKEEKINISDEALFTIAKNSLGGMRDALSLLDQISILGVEKEITNDDVNEMLGKISYDVLFEIVSKLASKDIQSILEMLDNIYAKGNEPLQILNNIIEYLRNVLIVKNCADTEIAAKLTQLGESVIKKLSEQAKNLDVETLIYWINKFNKYVYEVKNSTNRYLTLELCFIDVVSVCSGDIADLVQRVENLEARISSGGVKFEKTVPQAPVKKEIVHERPLSAEKIAQNPIQPTVEITKSEPKVVTPKPQVPESKVEEPVIEKPVAEEPKTAPVTSASNASWSDLLANIESAPTKFFFLNLATPQKLTAEEVVITFSKDIFVNQAKDEAKFNVFKKALLKYFNVNDIKIIITTKFQEKKEIVEEVKTPVKPPEKVDNKPDESEIEALEEDKKSATQNVSETSEKPYSDQVEMVKDLFNGKSIN